MTTNFTLSYSSYQLFLDSPLQFYFKHIAKAQPTNKAAQAYGLAGTAVHKALEAYLKNEDKSFDVFWNEQKVDEHHGHSNIKLDKEKYRKMFLTGLNFINKNIKDKQIECEKEFNSSTLLAVSVKGFCDVVVLKDNKIEQVIDWKTNSVADYEMHKTQRLFYAWLIHSITGDIPTFTWVYLKQDISFTDTFDVNQLNQFEDKLIIMVDKILQFGSDINKYESGNWKNPFNEYSDLCANEIQRRNDRKQQIINLVCKGNYVFIENSNDILDEGIDFATKFDEKNKWHMQQYARKNYRGKVNISDIGTIHLYNKRLKCFPIGLLDKVTKIIKEYGEYYNKDIRIDFISHRDHQVMEKTYDYPDNPPLFSIRDYQQDAIDVFMNKHAGIIHIATGGGKTFIATQIIKKCKAKVLWIIDRKELLIQTKKELEKHLGIKVGTIMNNIADIQTVTITTIQTISKHLNDFYDYLYTVNFVIVDEFHKSAAETYQKTFARLPNTKYRLGLTATPYRDDGKDPILFAQLGEIIYSISAQDLMNKGYLVKPEIIFYSTDYGGTGETYPEDYEITVSDNKSRNEKVCSIARNYFIENKKILILTKLVKHGELLAETLFAKHIHGSISDAERKKIFEDFKNDTQACILVMTTSIGAEGLDIPDIDVIINAGANAGDVKSVQIIGRMLRTASGKHTATYIDFVDRGEYTSTHSENRIKIFEKQGYEVQIK